MKASPKSELRILPNAAIVAILNSRRAASADTPAALGASPRDFENHMFLAPVRSVSPYRGKLISGLPFEVRGYENHDDARQHIGENVQ